MRQKDSSYLMIRKKGIVLLWQILLDKEISTFTNNAGKN